jgi:hypothetical protein
MARPRQSCRRASVARQAPGGGTSASSAGVPLASLARPGERIGRAAGPGRRGPWAAWRSGLPLERPMAQGKALLSEKGRRAAGVRVTSPAVLRPVADYRPDLHHQGVAIRARRSQAPEDPGRHSRPRPAHDAAVPRLVRPTSGRRVLPARAIARDMQEPAAHPPITHPGLAPDLGTPPPEPLDRLVRQPNLPAQATVQGRAAQVSPAAQEQEQSKAPSPRRGAGPNAPRGTRLTRHSASPAATLCKSAPGKPSQSLDRPRCDRLCAAPYSPLYDLRRKYPIRWRCRRL